LPGRGHKGTGARGGKRDVEKKRSVVPTFIGPFRRHITPAIE
jgi:hypothetical protein